MEWPPTTQGVHSGKQAQRSTGSSAPSMKSDDSKSTPLNMAEGRSCKSVDSGCAPSLPSSSVCSGSVLCDVCSDPAVKSCLTCMDSYCMTHVKDHYTSPDLQRHQLQEIKPSKSSINEGSADAPPPGQIQFVSVQPDSVSLRWSPPEGAPDHRSFMVTWTGGQKYCSLKVTGVALEVTELTPGERYHFTVATLSQDGRQSTCVEGTTYTEVLPSQNLQVDLRFPTASLTWIKPAGVDQVGYLLEICRNEEQIHTIHRYSCSYTIADLQPAADYTIRVSTVLGNGCQSKPISKTFRTGPAGSGQDRSGHTSSSYGATPPYGQPLRVVLLGKIGVGKSHVANVIVGREVFDSAISVTRTCQKAEVNEGRQIEVINTPGVMETERKPEVVAEEILRCIHLSKPGPHAFLLVIQVGRFTQEEQNTVKALHEIFGKKVADYMIVVFSRADELGDQTIEDYVQCGTQKLRDMIRDCGGRYVPFYRDLHNRSQVAELLRKVDELIVVNGGNYFSNEVYEDSIRESNSESFVAQWLNNMTAWVGNFF